MQKDFFQDEDLEPRFKVLKVRKIKKGKSELVIYVLTEPVNWKKLQKLKKFKVTHKR